MAATPTPTPPTRSVPAGDPLDRAVAAWRRDRSPAHMDGVLRASGDLIDRAAAVYGGGRSPLLRSHGRRLVAEALPRYDPAAGSPPAAFLAAHLRGLARYATRLDDPVRVPDRVRADRARLAREAGALRTELGREATDEELADRTHLSVRRIRRVRRFPAARAAGAVEAEAAARSPDGEGAFEPAVRGPRAADVDALRRAMLYDHLGPVDRLILGHTYGLAGLERLPRPEIVRRVGLSAGAVSQRAARIQRRLDELAAGGLP